MEKGFWLWQPRVQKKINTVVLSLFVFSTFQQGLISLAAPQLYARPGAGVSRLPLDVFAFNTPGFGDVADAINLATGSVYVSTDQVNRDNMAQGNDETANTISGGGWNLSPRLRLEGYRRDLTLSTLDGINSFFLTIGDSGGLTFTRVTSFNFATCGSYNASGQYIISNSSCVPTWIQRYKGSSNSTLNTNVRVYKTDEKPGMQAFSEYLVFVNLGANNMVAHYHDRGGNRTTFYFDQEYADFSQNLSQQYRTAKNNGWSEGRDMATGQLGPATDFIYEDAYNPAANPLSNTGRIARIVDEWGRVTTYTWNAMELTSIQYLLNHADLNNPTLRNDPNTYNNPAVQNSWSRKATFGYSNLSATPMNMRVITSVTYTAYNGMHSVFDGVTNTLSRTFNFEYEYRNNTVLIKKIKRPVAQSYSITTEYVYDTFFPRVITVKQYNSADTTGNDPAYKVEPDITYSYGDNPIYLRPTSVINCTPWIGYTPLELYAGGLSCGSGTTIDNASYLIKAQAGVSYQVKVYAKGMPYPVGSWPQLRHNLATTSNVITINDSVYREYDLGTYSFPTDKVLTLEYINNLCCGTWPANPDRNVVVSAVKLIPTGTNKVITVTQGTDLNTQKKTIFTFNANSQLTKKQVLDKNPYAVANTWIGPTGQMNTWDYTYLASGQTDSITFPSYDVSAGTSAFRKKVVYEYDTRGNVKKQTLYDAAGATFWRSNTMVYDDDNNLVMETLPAKTGTRGGAPFASRVVEKRHTTTYYNFTHSSGRTFRTVNTRKDEFWIDDNANGVMVWKNTLQRNFDESGRITLSQRTANGGLTSTDTYDYRPGNSTNSICVPSNATVTNCSLQRISRHYGDLIFNIINTGAGKNHWRDYDEFGNVVEYHDDNNLVADYTGAANDQKIIHSRVALTAFNGFGQQVWHMVGDANLWPKADSVWMKKYYNTGEVVEFWEGDHKNRTTYEPSIFGKTIGLPIFSSRWERDSSGVLVSQVENHLYEYDEFRRLSKKTERPVGITDYNTFYQYDNLDRLVRTDLPDGGVQVKSYYWDGQSRSSYDFPANSNNARVLGTTEFRNAFGLTSQINYDAHTWGSPSSGQTVKSVFKHYDNYDNLIAVDDSRLSTINNAGSVSNERSTLMIYDSRGLLIKKLEPPLRTAANGGYTDNRRPYTEYTYDGYGQMLTEKRALSGTMSSGSLTANLTSNMPGTSADTSYTYDLVGRVVTTTDPDGYRTALEYDPLNNLITRRVEVCKSGDITCKTMSEGTDIPTTLPGGGPNLDVLADSRVATTRMAYDAAGRLTLTVNPRGFKRSVSYGPTGLPLKETDERGIVTKVYTYTGAFLPYRVYEPDNNPSTAAAGDISQGYVITKQYAYTGRDVPSSECSATMDQEANSGLSCKSFEYDWAKRLTKTTLPSDQNNQTATIEQGYDSRGNVNWKKDAEGFRTDFTYDSFNKLLISHQVARSGNTTDTGAALSNGLATAYTYDFAGNLITKREKYEPTRSDTGLYTQYRYNSLGKVISESRPYTSAVTTPTYRLKTYRLDGRNTAETTYDYQGNLDTKVATVSTLDMPTVTAGSVSMYDYSPRGDKTFERAMDPAHIGNMGSLSFHENKYNGLGFRYYLRFDGTTDVYARRRLSDGRPSASGASGGRYYTWWKFSLTGKLVESWDEVDGEVGVKHNNFNYSQSSTDKETFSRRDTVVKVRALSDYPGNTAFLNDTNNLIRNGIVLGLNQGVVASEYNERDQLLKTTSQDNKVQTYKDIVPGFTNQITQYDYYKDGSRKSATAPGGQLTSFTYDKRGRIISVTDPNGANWDNRSIAGPATIATNHNSTGVRTVQVNNGSGACQYKEIITYTLDNLVAKTETWPMGSNCAANSAAVSNGDGLTERAQLPSYTTSTTTYSNASSRLVGLPQQVVATSSGSGTSNTTAYGYDNFGNRTTETTTGTNAITVTNNFNGINAVTQTITSSPSGYSKTLNYTLDGRGNRLRVDAVLAGGATYPYDKYIKRYDADGRVFSFYRSDSSWTGPAFLGGVVGNWQAFHEFRYDPMGREVLSIQARTWEAWGCCGTTYQGQQYNTEREVYSNYTSDGEVQLTRRHRGLIADYQHLLYWDNLRYFDLPTSTQFKDENYTYADGAIDTDWAAVKPFYLRNNPATALAAPTNSLSADLNVSTGNVGVLDVKPPSAQDTTPPGTTPTNGTGEVKAPDKDDEVKAGSQAQNNQGNTASNKEPGFAPLPDLNKANTKEAQQDKGLQAPGGVLPPTVQNLGTAEVKAPAATGQDEATIPGNTGKPDEVKQPTTPVPGVGTNPNDTPGTIAPPQSSGLVPPSIPKIDPLTQQPITAVQTPVGVNKGISAQEIIAAQIEAFDSSVYWEEGYGGPVSNDDESGDREDNQKEGMTGKNDTAAGQGAKWAEENAFTEGYTYGGDAGASAVANITASIPDPSPAEPDNFTLLEAISKGIADNTSSAAAVAEAAQQAQFLKDTTSPVVKELEKLQPGPRTIKEPPVEVRPTNPVLAVLVILAAALSGDAGNVPKATTGDIILGSFNTIVQADEAKNPRCQPNQTYFGGPYSVLDAIRKTDQNVPLQIHHMPPATSVRDATGGTGNSDNKNIKGVWNDVPYHYNSLPAIPMEEADHEDLLSTGGGRGSDKQAFRDKIADKIKNGDTVGAVMDDIRDVRRVAAQNHNGNSCYYDNAIKGAVEYGIGRGYYK